MKSMLAVVLVAIGLTLMVGAVWRISDNNEQSKTEVTLHLPNPFIWDSRVQVVIDPETHCEYIVLPAKNYNSQTGYAVTPRLGRDGKQICR